MAKGINKAILVGNLGNDPDMRYTAGGAAVANISIATAESWKDKTTGEQQERTEWHRVVGFGRLAEIMGQYLKKGSQVYIEGRIQTRKWTNKEGHDQYTTEIVANEMQMLGGKSPDGSAIKERLEQFFPLATPTVPPGTPGGQVPPAAPADDFNDEIPF